MTYYASLLSTWSCMLRRKRDPSQTRSTLRRAHAAMRAPLSRDLAEISNCCYEPLSANGKRGVRDNQGTKITLSLGSKPATLGF